MIKKGIVFFLVFISSSIIYAQNHVVCKKPFVGMVGSLEVVFNNVKDSCSDQDFPDSPVMAFKDASGKTYLFSGNTGSFMRVGSSLNNVKRDCSKPFYTTNALLDAPPESFDNKKWLRSPWTPDGKTIYSLVHNEFHGWEVRPDYYCPSHNQEACVFSTVTAAVSTDGGRSFKMVRDSNSNMQLAMVTPYAFTENGGSLKMQAGVRSPTNILSRNEKGKMAYYVLAGNQPSEIQKGGACLYRSDNLSDPSRWRAWDGKGFNVTVNQSFYRDKMVDVSQHACTPVMHADPSSWTFNKTLNLYLLVGIIQENNKEAFGYFTSEDMIHWSKPSVFMEITRKDFRTSKPGSGVSGQSFPSILDPESEGLNFEYSHDHPYLYYVRFNPKVKGGHGHNRDVVRAQLNVSCEN